MPATTARFCCSLFVVVVVAVRKLRFSSIFLTLLIYIGLLVNTAFAASFASSPLHHRLSKRELHQLFGVHHVDQVPEYDVVHLSRIPIGHSDLHSSAAVPKLNVSFLLNSEEFRIHVRRNDKLLSDRIVSVVRNGNSSKLYTGTLPKKSDCHYVGQLTLHSYSAPAAISGCGDQMHGIIAMPNHFLVLHPLPSRFLQSRGSNSDQSEQLQQHVVFRRSATVDEGIAEEDVDASAETTNQIPEEEFCAASFENITAEQDHTNRNPRSYFRRLSLDRFPLSRFASADVDDVVLQWNASRKLTIEMGIFLDQKLWEHYVHDFGESRAEQVLVDFAMTLVNNVHLLYQQPTMSPKIDIQVVRFELWKSQPEELAAPKHKNGYAQLLLDAFCTYQAQLDPGTDPDEPSHWDHGTLLTGFDLYHSTTSVAGVAPVARMCDKPFSCAVVEGLHLGRSFVLAHEMGHNLGMVHDGVQNRCSSKCCLMSPVNGAGKTTWSTCSTNELIAYLTSLGTSGQPENCLEDPFSGKMAKDHKADGRLPGQRFTADQQCALFWGRDYKSEIPSGSALSEICTILWCGNGGSSISTAHPALDGSFCGPGQWCRYGECTAWTKEETPAVVDGSWSAWTDAPDVSCSSCTILNSLRVRRQMRSCDNPAPNNGGIYCPGSDYRAIICEVGYSCTGLSKQDYGDRICSELRKDPEKGDSQLTGKSFDHPDSGCKIWCHLENSDLIRNKALFPDGTNCGNANQFCINGKCVERACDASALVSANPEDCPEPEAKAGSASWEPWTGFSSCSVSCGTGTKTRSRVCSSSSSSAKDCVGNSTETVACSETPKCIGIWGTWSSWGLCSEQCGPGIQTRNRSCSYGSVCTGSKTDVQPCNSGVCEAWNNWSAWSSCNNSCGEGLQNRNRTCATAASGKLCAGNSSEQQKCTSQLCVEQLVIWTGWSDCSVSCGEGLRERRRICVQSSCAGENNIETELCNATQCPEKITSASTWELWSIWTECTASCGGGTRKRVRHCISGSCSEPDKESETCNNFVCPVWSAWSEFGPCSVTCGAGQRTRTRSCRGSRVQLSSDDDVEELEEPLDSNFSLDSKTCTGNSVITEQCNLPACVSVEEAKPSLGEWQSWSQCSASCGGGTRTRNRVCLQNSGCSSVNTTESEDCNKPSCNNAASLSEVSAKLLLPRERAAIVVAIDPPEWSQWSSWSGCSCFTMTSVRQRYCNIRRPEQLGYCLGSVQEERDCTATDCSPVVGGWSSWGEWSRCSKSCGAGAEKYHYRLCSEPHPINRGAYCFGKSYELVPCTGLSDCTEPDVAGGWSSWTVWTECNSNTQPCSTLTRSKTRFCNSPLPEQNGAFCRGSDFEIENCEPKYSCAALVDGEFGTWSAWTSCSQTCGFSFKTRFRLCNNPKPANGGKRCRGLAYNTQVCSLPQCTDAVNGAFGPWSTWNSCTNANCGYGQQTRSRSCDNPVPKAGGLPCLGSEVEMQHCTNGDIRCRNLLSNQERLETFARNWEMYDDNANEVQ